MSLGGHYRIPYSNTEAGRKDGWTHDGCVGGRTGTDGEIGDGCTNGWMDDGWERRAEGGQGDEEERKEAEEEEKPVGREASRQFQ